MSSCYFPVTNTLSLLNEAKRVNNNDLIREFCNKITKDDKKNDEAEIIPKKVNIFQKMKQLTKDYWHILIPVHIFTSLGWVGIFYIAAQKFVFMITMIVVN